MKARRISLRCEMLEPRRVLDSTVVFNELMYHPADADTPEWIEFHNQMSVDMDLSGWKLDGGVAMEFAPGTVVAGNGRLVVASVDPQTMAVRTGVQGALGPWTGDLSNGGERLLLRDNNDRIMNEMAYDDDGLWPVGPDGSGATLARIDQRSVSHLAANWATSRQVGGTPDAENFPPPIPQVVENSVVAIDGGWQYDDSGVDLGTSWKEVDFLPNDWSAGQGLFFDETGELPGPKNTMLTPGHTTYYFRTTFEFTGDPAATELRLAPIVDDGAVYYLNGSEVFRQNMPNGPISFDTLALGAIGDATQSGPISVPGTRLVNGTNVLAVEVHQAGMGGAYSDSILASNPVTYHRLGETSTGQGAARDAAIDPVPPQSGPQNGSFVGFNSANLGQPGPRTTDLVLGNPLSGFDAGNAAPDFQGGDDGGNDVVLIPDDGELSFSVGRQFTLEAWVNGPATGQESGAAIIAKGTGGGGEQYAVDVVNGRFRFFAWDGGTPNTPAVVSASVGPNGTWQHVVAVYDQPAGVMRIYVNGEQVGTGAPRATLVDTTHEVSIGARKNSGQSNYGLNFDGRIDEVAIYNRALPLSEVQTHFNAAFDSGAGGGPSFDDVVFGLLATTAETLPLVESPQVLINEIAGAHAETFFVELVNNGPLDISLAGYVLASSDAAGHEFLFPPQTISQGQHLAIDDAMLGFRPVAGDRLFLYAPGKTAVMAAVTVNERLRGRSAAITDGFAFPSGPTPGAANAFEMRDDIVINEIMYHARPTYATADIPATFQTTTMLPIDANTLWRYRNDGTDLGTNWYANIYTAGIDSWSEGAGLLGFETSPQDLPEPIRTQFPDPAAPPANPFIRTYYFQTTFELADPASIDALQLRHVVDDGAIFYLNGTEVLRYNIPGQPGSAVPFSIIASPSVSNARAVGPVTIDSSLLQVGQNVLSVELHQSGNTTSSDVIFGAELLSATQLTPVIPGTPFEENAEEWIEIYNRGNAPVNLAGWSLADAVQYEFEAGTVLAAGEYLVVARDAVDLQTKHNALTSIIGPYDGRLANGDERIVLFDENGNPADEVHYYDGGRWDKFADGHGPSLELRDPASDNSVGEAWAASREARKSTWQTYTYRGVAETTIPGSPALWQEFLMGFLDGAGEALIDDVSVVEAPDGAAIELIQNGSFDSGTDHWRLLGNHQRSEVIEESGNFVMHLQASGATEYQGNQIETTLADGATIVDGREYEISFRAKWLAGSAQVNSRLYFNRLAHTTVLDAPALGGTPGAANSQFLVNAGPTYHSLIHEPTVPKAGQLATVSVAAGDPNGVAAMTVWYRVDDEPWISQAMTLDADEIYSATLPGQPEGVAVQFYVQGEDALGAMTTMPAAGPDSRALYKVDDGQDVNGPLSTFRVFMTAADTQHLHDGMNVLSNERLGATVITEGEAFYDVGIRLKGSFVGRDAARVGFNISFNPDQLYRGVHPKVAIDRSTHATIGVDEILVKHMANHAGGIPGMYDDLVHFIAPRSQDTSTALLRMAGYDEIYLDSQFENGSDGTVFEYEVLRWATTTIDGNPESLKRAGGLDDPNGFANIEIQNLGDDEEDYRWTNLIINNRARDDYERVIELGKAFSLNGQALEDATREVLDVDQWLRTTAYQSLVGPGDAYFTGGNIHNFRFYVCAADGKVLYMPWDWDSSFQRSTNASLVGGGKVATIIRIPANLRTYYGHLLDIIDTTYNTTYLESWTDHYGALAGQNFAGRLSYVGQRAASVVSQINTAFPPVDFSVTTASPLMVEGNIATVRGQGWVNLREMRLAGNRQPLKLTWSAGAGSNADVWEVTVPVDDTIDTLTLEAYDFHGNLLGTDSIAVTGNQPNPLMQSLRVTELMYHPPDPEEDSPYDADDYEFIELTNIGNQPLELNGVQFVEGISFKFPNMQLQPGQFVVVVKDQQAFAARYGADALVAGAFESGSLSNGGEPILLTDRAGAILAAFAYDDNGAWPETPDGRGASLEIVNVEGESSQADNWRSSTNYGGSPGAAGLGLLRDIVVNEVLTHTDPPEVDTIELYNASDAALEIGGWFLSDSWDNYRKFRIPDGTVLPAHDYLLFDENQFNASGGVDPNDFALDGARGDQVWLMAADANGALTRFADDVFFTAAFNGVSFGRWPNGQGELAPMRMVTLGSENTAPRVGEVVLSEVMYHPPSPLDPLDAADAEYVELRNSAAESADLTHWRLSGGIDFEFPDGTTLDAAERIVIVSFDPLAPDQQTTRDAFAEYYQLEPATRLLGPFAGRLDNRQDRIQLLQPDAPPIDEPDLIPGVLVDEVGYHDMPPWPQEADGLGASLHRVSADVWGNDTSNWRADGPAPGGEGRAPQVVSISVNGGLADPEDLTDPQPSSWSLQRSQIASIVVQFSEPIQVTAAEFVLTNLGVNAPFDADTQLVLADEQISTRGSLVRIDFLDILEDGVFQLQIRSTATDLVGVALDGDDNGVPGGDYLVRGNEANRFYQLAGEWNGDAGVSIFDFPIFGYWFGQTVPAAPEYVDLNQDGGISIFDFPRFAASFANAVVYPQSFAGLPAWSAIDAVLGQWQSDREPVTERISEEEGFSWMDWNLLPLVRQRPRLASVIGSSAEGLDVETVLDECVFKRCMINDKDFRKI